MFCVVYVVLVHHCMYSVSLYIFVVVCWIINPCPQISKSSIFIVTGCTTTDVADVALLLLLLCVLLERVFLLSVSFAHSTNMHHYERTGNISTLVLVGMKPEIDA